MKNDSLCNGFLESGKFVTGVNYLASNAGTRMWKFWDEDVIEKDLSTLAAHNIKIVRVMPIWPDFQPITMLRCAGSKGGRPREIRLHGKRLPDTELGRAGICETAMQHFKRFTEIAQKHGFDLIVPLLTGHVTFELLVPPALEGLDAFADPISLKWQKKFISAFVNHFKDCPAIKAWEVGNEANHMSSASSADEAWNWSSMVSDTIRLADNTRPVISGMHSLAIRETDRQKWLIADQAEHFDVLTPHPYPCWKTWAACEPCNSIRNVFHAVTENHFYSDIGQCPAFVEEIGTWRPVFSSLDTQADFVRNILWNVWAHNGRSMLWWCAFDQQDLDLPPYEWEEPGLEHGLFTSDHEPRPVGDEYRKFDEFVKSLPFDKLPESEADAVCILGGDSDHLSTAHAAMLLSAQAGFNIEFQASSQPLRDSKLYLMPSAYGRGGLSVERWADLREKVREGASLYMSLNNTYLDRIEDVFSAEVMTRTLEKSERTFEFNLGDDSLAMRLVPDDFNSMNSTGATVLGADGGGSPIFFEAEYGEGKVYLLGFALEKWMVNSPGAFLNEKTSDAWKIYRYIANRSLPEKTVKKAGCMTTLTEHYLDDGRLAVLVVNNSPEEVIEKLQVKDGWSLGSVYPQQTEVADNGTEVSVTVGKNNGVVVLLKK